jgi:hypothetical protein
MSERERGSEVIEIDNDITAPGDVDNKMSSSESMSLWKRCGIQSPLPFDTTEASLDDEGDWKTPTMLRRRKRIKMYGEYKDCDHYRGRGLGCTTDRDVEEHLDMMRPATRTQVRKHKTILGPFFGDTASSEDIHA